MGELVGSASQCWRHKRHGFNPWVGKIPWRKAWHPTPVFLPGESNGWRSLVGCSPWGCKESERLKQLSMYTHTQDKEEPNIRRGGARGKMKAQCLGFLAQTLGVFAGQ